MRAPELEDLPPHQPCLAICGGKHCARGGTKHLIKAAQSALAAAGLEHSASVVITSCQDYCDDAPAAHVLPGPYPYVDLRPATVQAIVQQHLGRGEVLHDALHRKARKRLKRHGTLKH